jgi:hypothetical protein
LDQETATQNTENEAPNGETGDDFGYHEEEDEGLYGWRFHKVPLIVAVVVTLIFYAFMFYWVD